MELQTSKASLQNVIKCVLIDLSGTIHIDDTEVPGSRDSLRRLRKSVPHIRFVTNTTKESKQVLCRRLVEIGFEIKPEEIFTSLTAACHLIQKKQVRPFLLVDDKALEDFKGIHVDNPNAVVVGLAPEKFDYSHMNTAFRLVLDGAPLIAIHKGRYYQRKDGLALGPGPFVTALEYATGQTAEVVGKPEANFFMSAIRDLSCDASECIMIGDDARDDIGGAHSCDIRGILVKTGKYRQGDELKVDPPPFQVVDDFKSAVDVILSLISQ